MGTEIFPQNSISPACMASTSLFHCERPLKQNSTNSAVEQHPSISAMSPNFEKPLKQNSTNSAVEQHPSMSAMSQKFASNNNSTEASAENDKTSTTTQPGLKLSEINTLAPLHQDEQIGLDKDIQQKHILYLSSDNTGKGNNSGEQVDFFGRPRPQKLVRKWPSRLMYLMANASDDEWRDVLERIRSHPKEVSLCGVNAGMNALHACCVRYPPVSVVRAMVETDPSVVLQRNFNGETPLHIASYGSSEEVQILLVQKVPEAATMTDQYGDSPLHFAARAGATFSLMNAFLTASPSMISQCNNRGVTPFWLLPRSYLESDDLDEVLDVDGEDYRDDWDNLALFLKYSYLPKNHENLRIRDEQGVPLPLRREDFNWIVHAAAATPSCPREVLRWLCRIFPEMALVKDHSGCTPLHLAVQRQEMEEPQSWNQMEDGFREHVEVADGELQNEGDQLEEDEAALNVGDAAFLERILGNGRSNDGSIFEELRIRNESVVELLLEWSPRSALIKDDGGRLPLTHALLCGLNWESSVAKLISAYPRALEYDDPITGLYNFQLAAMCSPQLDTVYSLVRSLPALLTSSRVHYASDAGSPSPVKVRKSDGAPAERFSPPTKRSSDDILSKYTPPSKKKPSKC